MRRALLSFALAAVVLAGCKNVDGPAGPAPSDPSTGPPSGGESSGGAAPRAVTIEIEAFEFRGPGGSSARRLALTLFFSADYNRPLCST